MIAAASVELARPHDGLAAAPVYGDAVVVGPSSYKVRSHLQQGDGFARIDLDNA